MQRTTNWKHVGGPLATVSALTLVLSQFVSNLVSQNTSIYGSTDFKIGVDMEILNASANLLCELMRLDSRGGFFSQGDLTAAVRASVEEAGQEANLKAKPLNSRSAWMRSTWSSPISSE
jgi:hypothetical protein